jgi:hypothetical protein
MNTPPFRRPRNRWHLVVPFSMFVVLLFCCRQRPDRTRIDPQQTIVSAGQFEVSRVTPRGALDVIVPTRDGDRLTEVLLLGISIQDEQAAVESLRRLAGASVRLRFDRRRVDETGTLQAYVFDGDLMLNEEFVRRGIATQDTHPADSGPIIRRIKKAEQEARDQSLGVWSEAPQATVAELP